MNSLILPEISAAAQPHVAQSLSILGESAPSVPLHLCKEESTNLCPIHLCRQQSPFVKRWHSTITNTQDASRNPNREMPHYIRQCTLKRDRCMSRNCKGSSCRHTRRLCKLYGRYGHCTILRHCTCSCHPTSYSCKGSWCNVAIVTVATAKCATLSSCAVVWPVWGNAAGEGRLNSNSVNRVMHR